MSQPSSTTLPVGARPGARSARVVLGIETSCDETAAALVDADGRILAEAVRSQLAEHAPFGGVVPEIAARAHVATLDRMIDVVMRRAGCAFGDLAGVAVTAGPGLIGGLMVGLITAKAIAAAHRLPLLAVNHLEAHALTVRLIRQQAFPYLLLLISGGHCQILVTEGVGRYRRLGTTLDDALGEAFDKAAKLLDLGYPGGPAIEHAALAGDPARFRLPRPMLGQPGCHFSFAGLKTALRQQVERLGPDALAPPLVDDLAASFQQAAIEALVDRIERGLDLYLQDQPPSPTLVVAGGVAANTRIRESLDRVVRERGVDLVIPPPALCTDNAVMVAWAGIERLALGLIDALDVPARARWPLDPGAEPVTGAGVKA